MTEVERRAPRQTISGLHYLRALATLLVVAVHVCGTVGQSNYFGLDPFSKFFWNGAGEVDLFFVMSGFIMIASTRDYLTNRVRIGASEFLRRRFMRVIPLLWIACISYAAIRYAGTRNIDSGELLRSLAVWPTGTTTPFVVWTIRHELLFYIIFSFCFVAFPRLAWLSSVYFLAPIILATDHIWVTRVASEQFSTFLASPFNIEFGLGIAIGLLWRRMGKPLALNMYIVPMLTILAAVRCVCWIYDLQTGSPAMVFGILPACLLLMIYAIKVTPAAPSRVIIFFGDASYSIFLFHPHLTSPTIGALKRFAPWIGPDAAAILAFALVVGLTSQIHRFLERPLLDRANVAIHSLRNRRIKGESQAI